jgi:serine/threonine protein kinase
MSDQPPVPSAQPPAPRRLGNYQILDKLGEGGMGEVWRARDERLHRTVAVKILPADVSNDPSRRARFEQEAHALGALNHPNIVAIYDVGADDGRAYLVSELVEGESLRALLDRGPLPVRKAIDLAGQIADGMAAAHALGIVHRDLKPENVMVTRSGQVKILDFGLAKQAPTSSGENTATMALSQPGTVLGTAGYMSPEQVRAEPVDARSDIFSFGAVLYEMVTGRRAFQASTSVETMHAVLNAEPPEFDGELGKLPPALATIVRRCLEKRPEQRFQSAADLAFALRSITGASITGVQTAITAARPARKQWLWPVAALLAAAVLFAAGFFLRDRTLHHAPPEFQKITFRKGLVARARFTPDGNIVYEASWDHGPHRIYLAVPGSPESRDLGINGDFGSVSSKQQLTLFAEPYGEYNSARLSVVSISGGQTRPLLDNVMAADWSPDGESLAVLRRVNGHNRLEYPIGNVLVEDIPWSLWVLRVSPDGNRVAFVNRSNGTAIGLNVVGRTGPPHYLGEVSGQNATGEDTDLVWSPKGNEIWFRSFNIGENGIVYAVDMKGHRRVALTLPERVRFFDISRKGDALMSTGFSEFGILGTAPGDKEERDLSCLDSGSVAGISDDGQMIIANVTGETGNSKGSLYLRKTDGSPPIRIGDGHAYKLSPDGKWISGNVLTEDGSRRFLMLPTGPGEPVEIKPPGVFPANVYGWFSQDRYMVIGYYSGKKYQCFEFDNQKGTLRPVCPEGIPDATIFFLSPDHKLFLSPGPGQGWTIYPVDGGPPQPLRGISSDETVVGWRSDSRSLYIRPDRENSDKIAVSVLDLATGQKTLWKEIHPTQPVLEIHHLFITPDGRAYAYNFVLIQSDLYVAKGLQ